MMQRKLVDNTKLVQEKIDHNLPAILEDISDLEGVCCVFSDDHELALRGKSIDYFLAMYVLAELIRDKKLKIELTTDVVDERIDYLYRLLSET